VGREGGRDGTVWKYPGDGCCFPLFVVDIDSFVSSFDFELDPSFSPSIVESGVNRFSPSGTPLAALALALSSLFALALSPPFANISLAACAFLSASSFAILSKFCILAILSSF
jgi:hypothetical protein